MTLRNFGSLTRRELLLGVGSSSLLSMTTHSCSDERMKRRGALGLPTHLSTYGEWRLQNGLPVFVYDADHEALPEAEWQRFVRPPTRRHWVVLGNRAIVLEAANDGTVALFDESEGIRYLTAADDSGGTGVSVLKDGAVTWGSAFAARPPGTVPERVFAPTSFTVRAEHDGLRLERSIVCPDGEARWLLIRVQLSLSARAPARRLTHHEEWRLRPRFLKFLSPEATRQTIADSVTYRVTPSERRIEATEIFDPAVQGTFGAPATLLLEALADTPGSATTDGAAQPTLRITSEIDLQPGRSHTLWFRFGRAEDDTPADPEALFRAQPALLRARLPAARTARAPEAALEVPWHAAVLTGGACRDRVLGGHTLDQASAYSFIMGFNGAVRDPLQHALPLVYSEPDLALSVLRNVAAWGSPDGDLPYGLNGDKSVINVLFRPSDSNLWALWLASEYAAVTGDLGAFAAEVSYNPSYRAPNVPLSEHLRRQFRFFVEQVRRGARDHVRILNADWNDFAIEASGAPRADMIERGGSVLNSAMASWVLEVYAGLAERLGQSETVAQARLEAAALRELVKSAYNGQWFHRAYAPDGSPVGDSDCWLEVQPWAILCGAATDEQARALLELIRDRHAKDSPLGARLIWPVRDTPRALAGEGLDGGIWYSINMTLIWAATRHLPDFAWSEWRKMTLLAHAASYPDVWEGTLSGPDAYNAPESPRPGRTWQTAAFAMQGYPVGNMHSHSQPLLAYLRLLGVEPTATGSLRTGTGGHFKSRVFTLNENGSGALETIGTVRIDAARGSVSGGPGRVGF
ncbi:MAG TPA: hypothetical protein VI072_27525 [Polyangiaceae bacterium]